MLTGSLAALLAALFAMWTYRYEHVSGLPAWHLSDLRNEVSAIPGLEVVENADGPALRLQASSTGEPLAIRLAIPKAPAVDALHLRFRMVARGLVPGREPWQDGRLMIEWQDPQGGSTPASDPVASVQDDSRMDGTELVVHPDRVPAVPALRLEHLGRSGEFDLSELELTPVRERPLWQVGRWFLAAGWLVWGTVLISSWFGVSRVRAMLAVSIWVILAAQLVVPGPWRLQRPMGLAFCLTEMAHSEVSPPRTEPLPSIEVQSGPLEALGKLPDQGSLVLRVKLALTRARPLLHAALLFAPALVWMALVGQRPALILAATLALSIELAQMAFGYGFDWVDVGDLACDAAGIALAWWVWKKAVSKINRLEFRSRLVG